MSSVEQRDPTQDPSPAQRSTNRPATGRILYALAARPGEQVVTADLAEVTGLNPGGLESACALVKRRIAEVPGASIVVKRSRGYMIWCQLLGMTTADVEALVGPCPPPASYMGHTGTGGDVVRILREAAPAPVSLAVLGAAVQSPNSRGTKVGQDKARDAVARVQRERTRRGETETIVPTLVDGSTGFAWGPAPVAAVGPAAEEVGPEDDGDGSAPVDPSGYWGRPPMRISLPSVDGSYVFTNDGLYLNGTLRSRGGSFPSPEMRY